MGYNAQLVVRSRDPHGTDIIDKVKALADEQDKTYSEMALELLQRGLEGGGGKAAPAESEPADEPSEASAAPEQTDEPEPKQDSEPEPQQDSEPEVEPETEPEAEPQDEPEPESQPEPEPEPIEVPEVDGSVADVAKACLEQLEAHGPKAAAQILANFFSDAGPIEGGKVKNILKDKLTKAEYEVILDKLRETKEYREYRQRVIFER
jgi:outer membrane biosynthesis protein TonB